MNNEPTPNDPLQLAVAAEQQRRAAQAAISQFINATAIAIYGQLVAKAEPRYPETHRALAAQARDAAPYLAEALGMVQVNVKPEKDT